MERDRERDALIEQYTPLADRIARRRSQRRGTDPAQVRSDARLALWRALQRHRPETGVPLLAFLRLQILRGVMDGLRVSGPFKRSKTRRFWALSLRPVNSAWQSESEGDDWQPRVMPCGLLDASDEVAHFLKLLPPRSRTCVELYFLQSRTLLQIARELGTSESNASLILKAALRRLRKIAEPRP